MSTLGIQTSKSASSREEHDKTVRIGIIGMGGRGCSLLRILLGLENTQIPAICDINPKRFDYALKLFQDAGHPKPDLYDKNEYDYENVISRDDLDAVIIATPWNWHAKMAVSGMKSGKYVGVEVPAAQSVEECWELIDAFEETGVPCMMLENWSFRRDNLAVLNMIREGLLGETVHSQCSYSHHCITYFFDSEGKPRWQGEFLLQYNRDQYPTHGLGPVLSWLNINCGDRFDSLVSVSTDSFGVEQYYREHFTKDGAVKPPQVQQGDIVSTLIKTKLGKTIYITNDMLLPRPYDNRWMVQGTKGIYSFERNSIYLEGMSLQSHEWEEFAPYQEKYEHRFWKNAPADVEQLGHGGPDYIELAEFVRAVRTQSPTPLDLYDSVTMSSVVALSGQSIAQKSAPVPCPDFTRGKWKTNKPRFGV
ncbi:MAG: Gfo/Idh/MocA family oxidoreductase [Candidatus Omnitrophica bacterium]|nr:Gfo/Idh/MocA family oxidoreductase [Candidatus Omnitrophota bacterium]